MCLQQTDPKNYLDHCSVIDWRHPDIIAAADDLADGCDSDEALVKRCFEFVRDEIKHSWDCRLNPVTNSASEVLRYRTGYCYAKSHLLAALLRANRIPAGLCYQRLPLEEKGPPYCLHGLNAVYLEHYGWYRIDARGNKVGVSAEFCPPKEQLAFPADGISAIDLPGIYAEPIPAVVYVLTEYATVDEVYRHLPDIDPPLYPSQKLSAAMNPNITIRLANIGDVDHVAVMVGELLHEIMDRIGEPVFNFDRNETAVRLKALIEQDKYFVFIAEGSHDVPVGFATVYESYSLYAEGAFGTIPELYVRPEHRSNYVGRALLQQVKVFANAKGWKRLEVTPPPLPQFDNTLAFYQREGFAISGGRKLKLGL